MAYALGRTAAGSANTLDDPIEELAAIVAAGDSRAVHRLIVAVTPLMLRAAVGVLGASHPEIDDVVQEAAVGFLRSLGSFRQECAVRHFVSRIAVFTALKARRRLSSRGDAYSTESDDKEFAPEHESPARALHDATRRQILRKLFAELPEAQSEALVMHFVLEMTVEEIAQAAGAPVNTVKSRLRLARTALRERVNAEPMLRDALEALP